MFGFLRRWFGYEFVIDSDWETSLTGNTILIILPVTFVTHFQWMTKWMTAVAINTIAD